MHRDATEQASGDALLLRGLDHAPGFVYQVRERGVIRW
jgi:hypothetical protein